MGTALTRLYLGETQICLQSPALEGQSSSSIMGKHHVGLHQDRKAVTAAESSEKVRGALCEQIRPSGEKFNNGEKVYYFHDNLWKGPGWIKEQDNAVVLIRYGSLYVCVHQSRCRPKKHQCPPKKNRIPNKSLTTENYQGTKSLNCCWIQQNRQKNLEQIQYYDDTDDEHAIWV